MWTMGLLLYLSGCTHKYMWMVYNSDYHLMPYSDVYNTHFYTIHIPFSAWKNVVRINYSSQKIDSTVVMILYRYIFTEVRMKSQGLHTRHNNNNRDSPRRKIGLNPIVMYYTHPFLTKIILEIKCVFTGIWLMKIGLQITFKFWLQLATCLWRIRF